MTEIERLLMQTLKDFTRDQEIVSQERGKQLEALSRQVSDLSKQVEALKKSLLEI
jgi:hypothetical protein